MAWVRSELPTGAGTVEGLERDGHAGGPPMQRQPVRGPLNSKNDEPQRDI